MKALVTGAGGFCGSHLTRYLENQGVEVHTISERLARREKHHQVPRVTDIDALERVVRLSQPDYIFHLAGVETEVRTEASRLKAVDVPAHYGSTAKLTRLLGPLTMKPLDSSLTDVLHDAMERPCGR